ncbi:DUF2249 domain-containing protein [Massilia agilis]|uniref:DUF2249 domain-containing protein n=1 Tax=Massilia agilis TaxID=1811226 RepID=A0ABT2DHR3_9BURK|nr:DUF2249 domain-containing protein [Massilia agilis]MCS0810701.1 DUF2249 domain-containing protein [Massilia agilis]
MPKTDPQDILLDVRGLPPPEPLERVLDALDTLLSGQRLRMLVDREPRPLYRILDANGHRFQAKSLADGSFEILIWPAS